MSALLLLALMTAQIDVPWPQSDKYTVADLQRNRAPGSYSGWESEYTIQPYLQVAGDLQELPENDRVGRLAEWSRIKSLDEPVIILCRILIAKSDGTPLRRPRIGAPQFVVNGDFESLLDEPVVFFEGIPFFIVRGYSLGGKPETASEYLKYALTVGRWKFQKFHVVSEEELRAIAEKFIHKHAPGRFDPDVLRRWVVSQIGPPHPSGLKTDSQPEKGSPE